ncbi:MAG: N-acetylmuramoyl-L-alanine amidase [Rhizobiaceae bacterium]|nr:N-acetylmuramoyl-L-alanine amidase [Rhizobiaceae bacterium]
MLIPLFKFLSSIAVLLSLCLSGQAQNTLPEVLGGNIAGDETSTRFFVNFSQNTAVQTFYMESPHRIIMDLSETTFDIDVEEVFKPIGLVEAVSAGRISQGRSRIVLTLAKPAEIVRATMQKVLDEDYFRFLLDIEVASPERFSALLNAQKLVLGESGNVAQKGDRVLKKEKKEGRFRIVIDPGHGGIDGGAVGKLGTREKEVVLIFAEVLAEKLRNSGPFEVLLTRTDDVFLSLRQRLDFNRRSNADLFISVHADSLNQRSVRGSTIYTLSKKASDRLSERLAESENSVDLIAGIQVVEESEALTDILIDLTTRETKVLSKQFSRILVTELDKDIKLIKNPLRSASFGVLKAPEVPSVLLELGYLSNIEDEKLMQSLPWKTKAADAVARAVRAFFEPRLQ